MQRATTALPNIQGVPEHLVNFSGLWNSHFLDFSQCFGLFCTISYGRFFILVLLGHEIEKKGLKISTLKFYLFWIWDLSTFFQFHVLEVPEWGIANSLWCGGAQHTGKGPKNDSVAGLRDLQDVWEHPVCIHINCLLQLPTILKLLIMYSYNIIQCIIVKFYQKYFHVQCTVTMFEINIIVSTKSSLKAF